MLKYASAERGTGSRLTLADDADVCSDLGIAQELGEGIRRIFAEMRRRGLTDPLCTQSPAAVRLTLSAADAVSAEIRATLPKGALTVLDQLRAADRPLSEPARSPNLSVSPAPPQPTPPSAPGRRAHHLARRIRERPPGHLGSAVSLPAGTYCKALLQHRSSQ